MSDDKATPVLVRMSPDLVAALDAYRRSLPDLPTRPEAVRRLVAETLAKAAA